MAEGGGIDPESLLGIKSALLKAGAAGTLLGILWRRQYRLWEALLTAAAGMCSTVYLAPGFIAWVGIGHDDIKALFHFVAGLLGMFLIETTMKYAPAFIRKRLSIPDDQPPKGTP